MRIELKNTLNKVNTIEVTQFIKELNNSLKNEEKIEKNHSDNITDLKENLTTEQKEKLSRMRKEGAIYEVTSLSDDCEDWLTELTNKETGETFQELEFPHNIYHQVGVGSFVKYQNGTYNVVEGTSVYDIYPDTIENYCENEGVYITKNGKYKTADELYETLNYDNRNMNKSKLLKNVFNQVFKIFKNMMNRNWFTTCKNIKLMLS